MVEPGLSRYGLLLVAAIFVLVGCSGSTARVQQSDVNIDRRSVALTPHALTQIDVSSDVSTFQSDEERQNYQASVRDILQRANLFGSDGARPYSLRINIIDFAIPKSSFSGFNSTLATRYELRDADGKVVYSEEISSGGSDDTGAGLGPVRQNRSRTVAVAKNIESFVQRLGSRLQQAADVQLAASPAPRSTAAAVTYQPGAAGGRPTDLAPATLTALTATGDIAFGQFHALIIGNNAYNHISPLVSAVADAQQLEQILRNQYGFSTQLLQDATRDEIVTALSGYRRSLGPTDNLLIYYAGHGWVDEQADEGYWLPVDAQSDDPGRWLSNATLTTTIRAMQARHILVIADSCFSGKLTRGVNVGIRGNDYLRRLVSKRARTALSSGGLEPVVDGGGTGNHSVFASSLFEALETNEGVIDTSQVFNFVRRKVALNAEQFPEYGDIRRAGHEGGDFVFVRRQN